MNFLSYIFTFKKLFINSNKYDVYQIVKEFKYINITNNKI